MTTDPVSADGDPRRLLADARGLARRVRVARRVTWLPLLVLAVVILGAIPVYRFSHPILSDCRTIADGQVCKGWWAAAQTYWLVAMAAGYAVIAWGYVRVAQARGLGARVLPYAITGVALAVLFTAAMTLLARTDALAYPHEPDGFARLVFRLIDFTGTIGLALLVLAWLERHVALLIFALVYLAVVLVPINFGWGDGWGPQWAFAPTLVITGGVLLLGSAGFALWRRK